MKDSMSSMEHRVDDMEAGVGPVKERCDENGCRNPDTAHLRPHAYDHLHNDDRHGVRHVGQHVQRHAPLND